jgi:hypothetical protein
MTMETIISGFKAASIVPFNPDEVLSDLGPIIESTPSPKGSQSSWEAKTPKTLPNIKQQGKLIQREIYKRRRSSASLNDKPF